MPSSLRMQVVWLLSSTREKILKFFKTMPSLLNFLSIYIWDFPADSDGKVFDFMWETLVQSLSQEDLLEKEMATHCSILAWKIPWTQESGSLQSMRSQIVGHDWATFITDLHYYYYLYLGRPKSLQCVAEKQSYLPSRPALPHYLPSSTLFWTQRAMHLVSDLYIPSSPGSKTLPISRK